MSILWSNWLGNQRGTPREIAEPGSVDEVVSSVEKARAQNHRIRVVGGAYAWSPLVPVDGTLISTKKLNRVRQVSPERLQITVETGATVRDVVEAAARHGMSVSSPSMFMGLTVGGLIATGSHGTGRNAATFGDAIVGFELVQPDGSVLNVTTPGSDLWRAVLANLGALGVITAVTLQCERLFHIQEDHWRVDVNESGTALPDMLAQHEFVELFWIPSTKAALYKLGNRTTRPAAAIKGRRNPSLEDVLASSTGPVFPSLANYPQLTPHLAEILYGRIGSGSRVVVAPDFCHYNQSYPSVIASEFAIPVEHAPEAWTWVHRRLMKYWASGLRPVNLIVHARFCRGSQGFLAPSAGRATCHLEVLSFRGNKHRDLFGEEFDRQMHDAYEGRPHWGKDIFNPARAAEGYGAGLEAFLDVRRDVDPGQRFLNPFLRDEVFGLGRRSTRTLAAAEDSSLQAA